MPNRRSPYHRGRVKTCTSEERTAMFSLLSFRQAVVSAFIFQTDEIEKDFLLVACEPGFSHRLHPLLPVPGRYRMDRSRPIVLKNSPARPPSAIFESRRLGKAVIYYVTRRQYASIFHRLS